MRNKIKISYLLIFIMVFVTSSTAKAENSTNTLINTNNSTSNQLSDVTSYVYNINNNKLHSTFGVNLVGDDGKYYNEHDTDLLYSFLQQTDNNNKTNGEKLNIDYNSELPQTYGGITWTEVNGQQMIKNIDFSSKNLIGTLNMNGCKNLETINIKNNSIISVDFTNCILLKSADISQNNILPKDIKADYSNIVISPQNTLPTEIDYIGNINEFELNECNYNFYLESDINTPISTIDNFSYNLSNYNNKNVMLKVSKDNFDYTTNISKVKITSFAGGDGTTSNPYQIENSIQLNKVREKLNASYILNKDIDLKDWDNGKDWLPIGYLTIDSNGNNILDNTFNGIFNGNGHIIKNLNIQNNDNYQGLFGYAGANSEIKNLGIADCDISGNDFIGGIVGVCSGKISNSYSYGNISGNNNVGGIAGQNFYGSSITNCYSYGNIFGSNNVGGISGENANTSQITNCYSFTTIDGNQNIGGIVGITLNDQIKNCIALNSYVKGDRGGRIAGTNANYSYLDNNFAFINMKNKNGNNFVPNGNLNGYNKTSLEALTALTYIDDLHWNDITDWKLSDNTLPQLKWANNIIPIPEHLLQGNVIAISTAQELADISNQLSSNYILVNDIDLLDWNDGNGWTPIGSNFNNFIGTFNGNGHTIKNLKIQNNENYQGLFGCVGTMGKIKNLSIINCNVSGNEFVGAIAGANFGEITNSCSSGSLSGTNNIGGIIGFNYTGGKVTNTYSSCDLFGSKYIGGIVGYNSGELMNAYSFGAIRGSDGIGGIVGSNSGKITNCAALNPYVNGIISVGRIIGVNDNGTLIGNIAFDNMKNKNGNNFIPEPNNGDNKTAENLLTALTYENLLWPTNDWTLTDNAIPQLSCTNNILPIPIHLLLTNHNCTTPVFKYFDSPVITIPYNDTTFNYTLSAVLEKYTECNIHKGQPSITYEIIDNTANAELNNDNLKLKNSGIVEIKATAVSKDGINKSEKTVIFKIKKGTKDECTINPISGEFNKQIQKDILIEMELNLNQFLIIKNGNIQLIKDKDYSINGNTITLKKEYLETLEIGSSKLTFYFSKGEPKEFILDIKDIVLVPEDIKVNSINLTSTTYEIKVNDSLQIFADIKPTNATNKNITWSIKENTDIASITETGLLTSKSVGTVTVVATANDGSGITGERVIIIIEKETPLPEDIKVNSIDVSSTTYEIKINTNLQMFVDIKPTNATNKNITWSIKENTDIASITETGLLTSKSVGTITVVATANDDSGIIGERVINIINPTNDGNNNNSNTDNKNPTVDENSYNDSNYDNTSSDTIIQKDNISVEKIKNTMSGIINIDTNLDKENNVTVEMTKSKTNETLYRIEKELKKQNNTKKTELEIKNDLPTSKSTTFIIPNSILESLIENQVDILTLKNLDIGISFDKKSLKVISSTTTEPLKVIVTKLKNADSNSTNKPIYNLTIPYKDGNITDLKDGKVTLNIPYKLQKDEISSRLYGVYIDDDNNSNILEYSSYDEKNQVLALNTKHFSKFSVAYNDKIDFEDTVNHWAKESIDFVTTRNILYDLNDTDFAPEEKMTRQMFISAIGKLQKIDIEQYKYTSFTDVDESNQNLPYIEWAFQNKIINGIGDNKFAPEQLITREQIAVMFTAYAQFIGYDFPEINREVKFNDSEKINSWAKEAVTVMQKSAIINGLYGNIFNPQGNVTKAEISIILKDFIELTVDKNL